jgi:hypothetical protein
MTEEGSWKKQEKIYFRKDKKKLRTKQTDFVLPPSHLQSSRKYRP